MTEHSTPAHIMPIRIYVAIWAGLMALTATTVAVAFQDLGPFNNIAALTIAVVKATLVVLFFMHAKYSSRLTKMVVISAVAWLAILLVFTMFDFGSRTWMGVPGK